MSRDASMAQVLEVINGALTQNLSAGFAAEQSFVGAGGTSVQALMIVDDIVLELHLGDHMATKLMGMLMLAPSLREFSSSLAALMESHSVL